MIIDKTEMHLYSGSVSMAEKYFIDFLDLDKILKTVEDLFIDNRSIDIINCTVSINNNLSSVNRSVTLTENTIILDIADR